MDKVVRELVEYMARAGRRGPQSRLVACLGLLVHLAMADAGYIADASGRVVSRYGITDEEVGGLSSAECDSQMTPMVAATVALPTIAGSPLSLVFCTRGSAREVDLDLAVVFSVRMTFAPPAPLSVVRAA